MNKLKFPLTGMVTSVGYQGAADVTDVINQVSSTVDFGKYFLIGVAGAVGGLLVKIIWGLIKKMVPSLNNIDK